MTQSSHYFIGLDRPLDLRKNLLEGAKVSVNLLKSQIQLVTLRGERKQVMANLQAAIKRINAGVTKLQDTIPKHSAKSMPAALKRIKHRHMDLPSKKKEAEKKEEQKEPSFSTIDPSAAASAIQQLESQLASIESKLNKL